MKHSSAAYHALLAIAHRDDGITPEVVVTEAQDPTSPLHQHFTWDDTEAAEKYRLAEAQALIRRYKIVVHKSPDEKVRVRAFSNVPDGDGSKYVPTEEAMADPARRQFVFEQATKELAQLRRKYEALIEFDEVLKAAIKKPRKRAA